MSNEPQREMTFEEWLDRLPKFHRVHKDFENLIAQAREEGRREAEAEIVRKDELLKIAKVGLEESRGYIDAEIDDRYSPDEFDSMNGYFKDTNPARVALEKIRNYPGIPEGSKELSSLEAPSKGTKFGIPQNANTQKKVPRVYGAGGKHEKPRTR